MSTDFRKPKPWIEVEAEIRPRLRALQHALDPSRRDADLLLDVPVSTTTLVHIEDLRRAVDEVR